MEESWHDKPKQAPQWLQKAREAQMRAEGLDPSTPENQEWVRRPSPRLGWITALPASETAGRGGYRHGQQPGGKQRNYNTRVVRPEGCCSVYRCYDAEARLLYVGITAKGVQRQRQHSYRSTWFSEMVRMEWEHFASKPEALRREAELIANENPLHNRIRPRVVDR